MTTAIWESVDSPTSEFLQNRPRCKAARFTAGGFVNFHKIVIRSIACAIILTAKIFAEKIYKKHIDIVFMMMYHINMKSGVGFIHGSLFFKGV